MKRWTQEEVDRLKELIPNHTVKEVAVIMGKTFPSVDHKVKSLKLKTKYTLENERKWNDEKDEFLRNNLNKLSLVELQEKLNTNYYSLMKRIKKLSLNYTQGLWTQEEINILIKEGPNHYLDDMVEFLPHRSKGAISAKAHGLGVDFLTVYVFLTEDKIKYIKDNWGVKTQSEIARDLHVGLNVINRYKKELNLPNTGQKKKWDEESINKIREAAKTKTRVELADMFNTTPAHISTIAGRYNITLIDSKKLWKEEDMNLLLELHNKGKSVEEISFIMRKNNTSIKRKLKELKLTPNKNNYKWDKEDETKLINIYERFINYEGDSYKLLKSIAIELNKSTYQIENKLRKLKYKIVGTTTSLTEEEIEELKEYSTEHTMEEAVDHFKKVSTYIRPILLKYNLYCVNDYTYYWKKEEVNQLIELVNEGKTIYEIATILNRTPNAIKLKLAKINVELKSNRWSQEEIDMLKSMWGKYSKEEIASKLNRTVSSINNKAFILKLGSFINNIEDGLTIPEISKIFKIDELIITTFWASLGLPIQTLNVSNKKSYQYIILADLLEFLRTHQNSFNASLINEEMLEELPIWIQEKAKYDALNKTKIIPSRLTKEEMFDLRGEDVFQETKRRLKKKL